MIAKFVKGMAISMLMIGTVLVFQSVVRHPSYSAVSVRASNSSSAPDAAQSGSSEAGKPVLRLPCKAGEKASSDSAGNCSASKAAIQPSGQHSLALRAKSGGAG